MNPMKERTQDDDFSPISPMSTMTGLTPISPFTLLYLSNFANFSPFTFLAEQETRIADEVKEETSTCKCRKTKCIRLYCDCFANGKYCKDCNCKDCKNQPEFIEERDLAKEKIKAKNPGAFRLNISSNYQICHCSKSFCQKKYCECFQNGRECNANCKCKECKNTNVSRVGIEGLKD